ncbi:MAG: citrate synthase [Thermoplasmata archaeon]
MTEETISRGLEDVNIKWTRLTTIDGEKGILMYAGYSIEDIINSNALAEEIQYLFLYGKLPNKKELEEYRMKVEEGYNVPDFILDLIMKLPPESDAVAMQMVAYAALAAKERNFKWDKSTNRDVAARSIGMMSTITANVFRHIMGKGPKKVEKSESYAKSFLRAVFDKEPTKDEIDAMNAALILYTDHEVPASTTAGLVAVSTLSDIYSGVTAALAALKGPLHGGAAEAAIMQFEEIGDENKVDEWFNNLLKQNKRLMGFGHRVYKTYDPRAKIFKRYAEKLIKNNKEAEKMYRIATRLEELGIKQYASKGIYPNTDYYSGIVYMSLGFPLKNNMYTGLFALSRITGWEAHFIEYVEEQHRLIRPRAVYKGPEKREFIPLDKR